MNKLLKQVQEIDYDALKSFIAYCRNNNISFFLRGGSVMGAVKYNDFIPWDDDIDVAIPRRDYEKLVVLSNRLVLNNKYRIVSYKYDPNVHCYFLRMVLPTEECKKMKLTPNTNLGLHIMDIFPLDGSPNSELSRKLYVLNVYVLRVLASLGTHYTGDYKDMHSKKQKLLIKILRIMGFEHLFPQRKIYTLLDKLYRKHPPEKSLYSGTISASQFAKELMPSKVWGQGTYKKIRDLDVLVPEKYDNYLQRLYGKDYLTTEPQVKKSHLNEVN